jgi:aryl-alcohol dehydrogenase-like predicted oxidoreductase
VRYALSVQGVDNVIVGVDSVEQLQEILAAAAGKPLLSLPAWPRQIETDLVNPSRWSQI